MTTPGGVPNLPPGALTLDTLADKLQDMSGDAMKARAVARFPPIMGGSTGLDPALDITPFGILTRIFAEVNSLVATADPADIQGPEDLPPLLLEWIEGLPFVGELVDLLEAILGTYDGDDETLLAIQEIFAPIRLLMTSLESIDLTGSPEEIWQQIVSVLILPLNLLIGPDSPLNALNIFGNIPSSLLGLIPASGISSANPNLLSNAGFEGSISLSDGGGWTWDAVDGHTSPGCATATADGTLKAIHSNTVYVAEGQELDLSVWVQTVSYAGTGTPLRLGVRTFLNGATVGTTTIASRGAAPSWSQLSGSYTVPAGVDAVRLRAIIDTTATGGTVRFDDGEMKRAGNGPFDGVLDLFGLGALGDLSAGLDVDAIWTAIINTILHPLNLLFHQGDDIPDTAVPGIGGILDNLFGGINLLGSITGASHSQAQEAIEGQASSLVNTNATVAQILAALGPGNADADDFERTGSTPGSSWDLYSTGTGTVGTPNGHDLVVGGTADFEYVMRRNTSVADDDGMVSSIILGTAPEAAPFLLSSEFGCNDVWIRLGTFTTWATRIGVRLRYQATKELSVDAFNSGTGTTIMSPITIPPPPAGAALTIEAIGSTRQFILRCGGYSTTFTEVGTASQVGASFRGRGIGGRTENTLLATAHPGTTKQWTGQG